MTQLVTLMYHKVHDPINHLPTEYFVEHLAELVKKYAIVAPHDQLHKQKLNVCLTFDDAYCDFYQIVFPLLKQHNIKALLAVPTAYIQESTELSYEQRSKVAYPNGMDTHTAATQVPFCTWEELKEMQSSGHVIMASHSHTHASMKHAQTDLKKEILQSKQLLEEHLKTRIDYFVYPFGHFTRMNHRLVTEHYALGFRIGSATNRTFTPKNKMIYRIDADHFWKKNQSLEPYLSQFKRKYWLNRLRFK